MADIYKNILGSINFETSLLEAVDWDEDRCKDVQCKLSEYFLVCSKDDLELVKVDLEHAFSRNIAEVVYNYLKQLSEEKINDGSKLLSSQAEN